MNEDKEWLDVVHEINSIKDTIKDSAKKIIAICNEEKNYNSIDKEFLEILNGLGKIGILSNNPENVLSYSRALSSYVEHSRLDMRLGKELIKNAMNQVCSTSFYVNKKGKKFEINIPKLDFSLFKI